MALVFRLEREAPTNAVSPGVEGGRLVVVLDANGVATYQRLDNAAPLAANEARLRYRIRNGRVKFGTNAYFFEEGHVTDFAGARYGEFRVAADGEAILTGLRDQKLAAMGSPAKR